MNVALSPNSLIRSGEADEAEKLHHPFGHIRKSWTPYRKDVEAPRGVNAYPVDNVWLGSSVRYYTHWY